MTDIDLILSIVLALATGIFMPLILFCLNKLFEMEKGKKNNHPPR